MRLPVRVPFASPQHWVLRAMGVLAIAYVLLVVITVAATAGLRFYHALLLPSGAGSGMATERLSMRKIREMLRLKWVAQRSHREVARSLGVSPGAVASAVGRARAWR